MPHVPRAGPVQGISIGLFECKDSDGAVFRLDGVRHGRAEFGSRIGGTAADS